MDNNNPNNFNNRNTAAQNNQRPDPTSVTDIDSMIQNENHNVPRTNVSVRDINQLTSMFAQMTASNQNHR